MLLIHTKCYKLVEKPLIMLFCFNIRVPSPLFKKTFTSHFHLFIICILLCVTSWSICSWNSPLIVYILNVCWILTEGLVEDWLLHQTSHPLKIKTLLTYLLTLLISRTVWVKHAVSPNCRHMGPVKRKSVFESLRPGNIQTSLLSYRD